MPKRPYHHGDLRNALIEAAARLARTGGPDAVTVRAAAREVGVTPTAAYRHFAGHEELLGAAQECALENLTKAMRKELSELPPSSTDPGAELEGALRELAALGRGYINFALTESGQFRTVFSAHGKVLDQEEALQEGSSFAMLMGALDRLVEIGYLPADKRPMAEVAAWAMMHGVASLLDGPLRQWPAELREAAITQAMLVIAHGLAGSGLPEDLAAALADELRKPVE